MSDNINPAHYKQNSIEVIEMMIRIWGAEKVAIHCEITAFKYRMRAGYKADVQEEINKAKWYEEKAKYLNSVIKNNK